MVLVCPACKGRLIRRSEALSCRRCGEEYPSRWEMGDLRPRRCRSTNGDNGWNVQDFEKAYEKFGEYASTREYARRSGISDLLEDYRYPRVKGRLLQWAGEDRSARSVLDVGCGGGDFLLEIEKRLGSGGSFFAGIDVVPVRIRHSLKKFQSKPNFIAVLGSAEELPFADRQFDLITCTEVLEHIEHPEAALHEIARVLRPGGTLCLSSPNLTATDFWERAFAPPGALRRLVRGTLFRRVPNPYDKPIGSRRLLTVLRRAGLRVEDFERNVFLPHESYFQFLPEALERWVIRGGGFLESRAKALSRWLGLHYVIRARRR
ncbi:MAG: methyltransferase domain-containing protein [Planctomycetota bacterium]|nr:methyltransferase domain-containing protein [Planctomycetota bacterium]